MQTTAERVAYNKCWVAANKERHETVRRAYYLKHRERLLKKSSEYQKTNLRAIVAKRMGLSVERYAEIKAQQNNACFCGIEFIYGTSQRPCIDHDHACCPGRLSCGNCVRGLLCSLCNKLIGLAKENPLYLPNFLRTYLNVWQAT